MAVPSFEDIGRNAREIFRSGYHYGHGLLDVSITNKSQKNLQINSRYTINCDSSKADGSAEAKLNLGDIGTFKEKWKSDGTILVEYETGEKRLAEGLSLSTGVSHNPATTMTGLSFAAKYITDSVHLGCSVSNALDANVRLTGSAVLGTNDLHLGYRTGYDTETGSMTLNDLALAYTHREIGGVHLRATRLPREAGASLFYRVTDYWDTAINGIFASRGDRRHWTIGVATRIRIAEDTTLRFKLNKDRQLGASLQQKIHDFVTLTLSLSFDLNDPSRGDHKVGLGLDVNDS